MSLGKGCYERYPQLCYCPVSGEKELGSYAVDNLD